MSTRTRINVQGATLPRMDRVDIWIGGYHAAMVSAFSADIAINDENTPVFGYDATIDTRVLDAGTLTLTQYEHPDKVASVLDLLMGIDPASSALRAYKAVGSFVSDVVRLTRDASSEFYIAAEFFPGWNPVLRPKQGDPKAAGTRALEGRTGIPLEFRMPDSITGYVAVAFDVANLLVSGVNAVGQLATAPTITAIPAGVPGFAGKFALAVEVQHRDTANKLTKSARLSVTASMIDASGNITITPNDLAGTPFVDCSTINYCHVYFLVFVNGSFSSPMLLADGITVRGRYDTVPPAAPTAIAGTGGVGQLALTWTDNANSETGFQVQISSNSGVTWGASIAVVANATSKTVTGLSAGTTYRARVRSIALDEVSAWNTLGTDKIVT